MDSGRRTGEEGSRSDQSTNDSQSDVETEEVLFDALAEVQEEPSSESSGRSFGEVSRPGPSQQSRTGTQIIMTTNKIQLGTLSDVEFVDESQAAVGASTVIMFPMETRKDLEQSKLQELFTRASGRRSGHKYEMATISLDDPDTLQRTCSLSRTFTTSESHLTNYDMANVFQVFKFDPNHPGDPSHATQYNLFKSYALLTAKEVAASNKFYSTRIKDKQIQSYVRQNLQVSMQYFENNCTSELLNKVQEECRKFKMEEQGGPLFFKIMVELLLVNTRNKVNVMLSAVKKLKISEIPGEDVSKAVSLIGGTYDYLKNLEQIDPTNPIPSTFTRDVLRVLQTTSDNEFNSYFQAIVAADSRDRVLDPNAKKYTVDDILQCASHEYRDRIVDGTWDGIKEKKNETKAGMAAAADTERRCFNCGDTKHTLKDCPKPLNEDRVKANKKKQFGGGKKSNNNNSRNTSSKWAPPTEDEKKNHKGKRVIDGKPMYYHYKRKRWLDDKFPEGQQQVQVAAQSAPTPAAASAPSPARPAAQTTGALAGNHPQQLNVEELNAFTQFRQLFSQMK